MSSPSLLVFGSQTSLPSSEYCSQLRQSIILNPRLRSLKQTIEELPSLWPTLVAADPLLEAVPGQVWLEKLRQWLATGDFPSVAEEPLLSVFVTPLTVIVQLTQYLAFTDPSTGGLTHVELIDSVKNLGGVQGFCTGLLSAIAVGSAEDDEAVCKWAAVALKLAVCIGACVDIDGACASPANNTACIAVRWRPEVGKEKLMESLKVFPDSYISVVSETNCVTVTASQATVKTLANQLSSQGLIAKPIRLNGRFHSPTYKEAVTRLQTLCASHPELQFPAASTLRAPIRSNTDAQILSSGSLNDIAIKSILFDLSNWHITLSSAVSQLVQVEKPVIAQFGLVDCIPSSAVRDVGATVLKLGRTTLLSRGAAEASEPTILNGSITPPSIAAMDGGYSPNSIAIVGMACHFPGANNLAEFWDLLTAGTSMCKQMPKQRFDLNGLRRSSSDKLKFFGNFVDDIDAFDHKFFKKSSREAASMDPQQRLLLQVCYQAMESAGYFGELSKAPPNDIGCYVGVCASDYNDNVASHDPNAYSSLGTLRAFLSGKLSHFFGWTGPSITYDTACSSSAVAIDAACRAIRTGECTRAVAGGVSLYTSPNFYQNLAAASFLSPTGPTKPFDAKGDGYCRGEGIGLVVLKRLSDAMADGDHVMGVIASSSVNQNYNTTAITVPHSVSQVELYQKVAKQAAISPQSVSYVEAHGTGTPVGDPIEFESIRRVFGGAERTTPLHVASVKGNIGHLEGASGVAALIKTVLMMENRTIPVQANHTRLNPKIPSLEVDNMAIPLANTKWEAKFQIACINNYGAAGSNAAMIVTQAPKKLEVWHDRSLEGSLKYPIFVSANTSDSLKSFCRALSNTINKLAIGYSQEQLLADVSYNLCQKQNRSLPHAIATSVSTLSELREILDAAANGTSTLPVQIPAKVKPTVLVFGGQVSTFVGLSEDVYNASSLLRSHLEHCDYVLQKAGLQSIFPAIFQTEPVEDTVLLHSMFFAIQYACAMSWIDSGLAVEAVVGHSFGQLTGLTISGVLSLEDGLKLVTGRAKLMQTSWGKERGSMVSVQADVEAVLKIVNASASKGEDSKLEIACYNGPTSHVLVGTSKAVDFAEEQLKSSNLKYKRLNVTHGFHSVFTEPLLDGLTKVADTLTYNEPSIHIETCSNSAAWTSFGGSLIAEHTRTPVYFGQAVQRLADKLGPCTWLEAGSGSGITSMVRAALVSTGSHTFQPVQLSGTNSAGSPIDATINLWKTGHKFQHWSFHHEQKSAYKNLTLPPYQFEKSRHWLDWKDSVTTEAAPAVVVPPPQEEAEPVFLSLVKYLDAQKKDAEFAIDPRSKEWKFFVGGHAVLAQPLCPAPLYIEIVSQAVMILAQVTGSKQIPCVEDLEIQSPLGVSDRLVSLELKKVGSGATWQFSFSSKARDSKSSSTHATGKVSIRSDSENVDAELSRFERLVGHRKYSEISADLDAEALRGIQVYKVFSKVVTYAPYYKGVKAVYGKDYEVAGNVSLPKCDDPALKDTVLNPIAMDNFIQVAGLHVNALTEIRDNEVYVCTKVDRLQPAPKFVDGSSKASSWLVYSNYHNTSDRELVNDIFVFDAETKALVFVVLGARFTRVMITSMAKVLSRANVANNTGAPVSSAPSQGIPVRALPKETPVLLAPPTPKVAKPAPKPAAPSRDFKGEFKRLLVRVAEVPMEDLVDGATLEDMGVDSLMITEVLTEINKEFQVDISMDEFATMVDIDLVVKYLQEKLGGQSFVGYDSDNESDSSALPTPQVSTGATTPDVQSAKQTSNSSLDNLVLQLGKMVAGHLETTDIMTRETNLAEQGMDSLLCMELASDIKKDFDIEVDMSLLDMDSTFGDLVNLVVAQAGPIANAQAPASTAIAAASQATVQKVSPDSPAHLTKAQSAFEDVRFDYDIYTKETGFYDFWKKVYPIQAKLVLAYTVEAFARNGCDLASIKAGQPIPAVKYLPKHQKLVDQLHNVLRDGLLISASDRGFVRSDTPVDKTHSSTILAQLQSKFPQHTSEHKLLDITGSKLGECLTGDADPLGLLFRSKANKDILEDVYHNGPMYLAISRLLGSYFAKALAKPESGGKFNILELGGGTGGTTKYLVDFLINQGIPFTYTFTDISGSLVAAARKRFAGRDYMEFMTCDIEKEPADKLKGKYHAILSTNCIHATKNLEVSTGNMRKMLRPDGFISLVEFTRNMYWFDLVFGLLDGWWMFNDGRPHVLATEWFWDNSMRKAGFEHVTWTDGTSEEARTLRIITGFNAKPEDSSYVPQKNNRDSETSSETVLYKQVGSTALFADVYYPPQITPEPRPIALMIHGGGHVMLSRKDIRPKQTAHLHSLGFLPVSVDYRLCPEVDLLNGPMTDVCDALDWARTSLPKLPLLNNSKIDTSKLAVVGWSTGGHLAMTTAFTTVQRGIAPPTAILSLYCPTDYEDPCWSSPNYPEDSVELASKTKNGGYDVLESINSQPLTAYNVPKSTGAAVGGWYAAADPRSRLVLHMNWSGQCLPVLLNGLPPAGSPGAKELANQAQPEHDRVVAVSPYAQIKKGVYKTPTFIIHGDKDDLIPWEQSVRVSEGLKERGISTGVDIPKGKIHLFDLYRDADGSSWASVSKGYDFISREVFGR